MRQWIFFETAKITFQSEGDDLHGRGHDIGVPAAPATPGGASQPRGGLQGLDLAVDLVVDRRHV